MLMAFILALWWSVALNVGPEIGILILITLLWIAARTEK
jgi:hypothetical protein